MKENDVILLNRDTEVTKKWLDKMRDVAYVRDNVASVTPLSNNATLAPHAAQAFAKCEQMIPPAPVTTTTLSFKSI